MVLLHSFPPNSFLKGIGFYHKGKIEELRILGEGLGAEIGATVFIELKGKTYIPIHDHQGSLKLLLDSKGNLKEVCRYTAFGEQLTPSKLSPWRFASKRYDDETGYTYFGRRYYSPLLGRFITPDPLGFDDGPNLYAYVHNCPMIFIDAHGFHSDSIEGDEFQFGHGNRMLWKLGHVDRYLDWDKFFPEKSCHFDLKDCGSIDGRETAGFINGIRTDFDGGKTQLEYLSQLAGGKNISGVYNASHGGVADLVECYLGIHGVTTNPSRLLHNQWNEHFASNPGVRFL
ncbi:MAG: hypothetical protein SP4CHLAM17_11850 [Chlamydiales bacterium]|nr:hypothetical protein [Chlamydiales bacterium]